MTIDLQLIGIYLAMVIFGLIAYAWIIPYFVVKKFRSMLSSGEGAEMILELMDSKITIPSPSDPNKTVEMSIVSFLVAHVIQNFKMTMNGLKSAIVRGALGDEGAEASVLDAVPKKWRWAVQLFGPIIASRIQAAQGNAAMASGGAVPTYR